MGTTILTFNTALSASFFFSKKNESQIYPCFLLHPLYLPILITLFLHKYLFSYSYYMDHYKLYYWIDIMKKGHFMTGIRSLVMLPYLTFYFYINYLKDKYQI